MSFSTKHTGYIERDYLNELQGSVGEDSEKFSIPNNDAIHFIKILGISDFWQKSKENIVSFHSLMQDTNAGFHSEHIPLIYLIVSDASKIHLFLGTYQTDPDSGVLQPSENRLSTLIASVQSAYPGIEVQPELSKEDGILLQNVTKIFQHAGLLVGTPTVKVGYEAEGSQQIERLIRGLYSTTSNSRWAYIVTAVPRSVASATKLYNSTLNELKAVEDAERSAATQNTIAERYKKLLKLFLQKLDSGKAQGLWHVATYFLAEDLTLFNHSKAILKSVFAGGQSRPDPIRVIECPPPRHSIHEFIYVNIPPPPALGFVEYPFKYLSLLSSQELAALTHLPMEETPGYFVKDFARFDVSPHCKGAPDTVMSVGEVIDQGQRMGFSYQIEQEHLNRHGLIVGTTGSGKTNTVFYLLKQLWQAGIPFMVIEPAKTEYRKLFHSPELGQDLQLFTLGDDVTSPFRLNPFEIRPGVSVQTHIDYLKSVFNASFTMYAPTPYVLERCIHEVYEDMGWDLVTGENSRGFHWNAQPTLSDLYRKVDEVVDRLGYEAKITMDVKAALKTRINSLRIGSKGLMLDTRTSTPVSVLLQKPTVLELEQIGDDDEKAFVIGLLMAVLNEHYISQGLGEGKGLTHLTVIEEAHRLFKNVPQTTDPETANVKGKAVETFCNILSEIRAYGEGFLIAEQIPSKLAPDVVKNTNLKVMHRIVAADDRSIMGATMNMELEQIKRVASFATGEASVYSEGDDGAILIKVPYSKLVSQSLTKRQENQLIRDKMGRGTLEVEARLMPTGRSSVYYENVRKYGKEATHIVEDGEFREVLARYIVSTVISETVWVEEFPNLIQTINPFRKGSADTGLIAFALAEGVHDYFERHGQRYGWQYRAVEELETTFLNLMFSIAYKRLNQNKLQSDLSPEEILSIQAFQAKYKELCQLPYYPFQGCSRACPNQICLYRYNVRLLLGDMRLDNNFLKALSANVNEMWKQMKDVCQVVERRVGMSNLSTEEKRKIGLCFVIQKSEFTPSMDTYLKEKIVANMTTELNS
jgi:DNA helicase HerA-like ATPase